MITYAVVCYDESVSGIVVDSIYNTEQNALNRVKRLEGKHPDRNFDETDVHAFCVIAVDSKKAK